MKPLITVIIPVYNVEQYLRECLDSIVNQTMEDLQIICVNDGATDHSLTILEEYAAKDRRVFIINQKNSGQGAARNHALNYAQGKYTLYVDADDWVDVRLCERTYAKAEETDADAVCFLYERKGTKSQAPMFFNMTLGDKTTSDEKLELLEYLTVWGKLWKTGFLKHNKIACPEGVFFEDCSFIWQCIVHAKKIVMLPEVFYYYRYNDVSTTGNRGRHYCHIGEIMNHIKNFLMESGHYEEYKNAFLSYKLCGIHYQYQLIRNEFKPEMLEVVERQIGIDERAYYPILKKKHKNAYRFYMGIEKKYLTCFFLNIEIMLMNMERFLRLFVIHPLLKKMGLRKNKKINRVGTVTQNPPDTA